MRQGEATRSSTLLAGISLGMTTRMMRSGCEALRILRRSVHVAHVIVQTGAAFSGCRGPWANRRVCCIVARLRRSWLCSLRRRFAEGLGPGPGA